MTDTEERIQEYVREVKAHLVGPAGERSAAVEELKEFLTDAAEAGELDDRLRRLGTPEEAARSFTRDRTRPLAPIGDRLVAAAVDNLPLIAVAIGLFLQGLTEGNATLAFPPFVYLEVGGGCVALLPVPACDVYIGGWIHSIGLPIALVWSIVGLGFLESWKGTTPGKRLMGLHVVTEEGTRITLHAGIVRRSSFLVGPVAWLDWVPALWGDRQRVLDKVAATKVVLTKIRGRTVAPEEEET